MQGGRERVSIREEKEIMIREWRSLKRNLVLFAGLVLVFVFGNTASASEVVMCRWGDRAEMEPVPGCGVPRTVEVNIPKTTFRLYFARGDNPGLSGYYFLGRSPQASPREILNRVNVSAMSLMLCPSDFKEERVLAFQDVARGEILKGRPTCRLGPPPDPGKEDEKKIDDDGADDAEDDDMDEESPKTVTGVVQPPEGEKGTASWKKIDRYARLLGVVAVGMSLICFVGLVILALLFAKRLRRIESNFVSASSFVSHGSASDKKADALEAQEAEESESVEDEIIALEKPVSKVEDPDAGKNAKTE